MHPDNKLASHGKQVTGDGRSQIPSVNQQAQQQQPGAAPHLGSKGIGAGSHGVKTNHMSLSTPGLKVGSQSVSGAAGMLKTKSKRERSVSIDSGELRTAVPAGLETDAKGGECQYGECCFVLIMQKFTSFTSLSARSLPETPDYVHSPPPQQEVNTRTRGQKSLFSLM